MELVVPLEFTPMVVVPGDVVVARPATLGLLAIVAMLAAEELQWLL